MASRILEQKSLKTNRSIYLICFGVAILVVLASLFFLSRQSVFAANKVVGFTARLQKSTGAITPDGNYNIRFKLYNQSSGGSAIWTEVHYDSNGSGAGNDNRIRIKNGYMSVQLGSQTALPDIDWSSDVWLTMDIGGTVQEGVVSSIPWDGEMSPRIQLTSVPYALSAGSLDGKKSDDFVQLGQGVQTDASDNSSIFINKTGTGDLVQLQSSGSDALTISQSGSITMGASDQTIRVGASSGGIGHNLTISAGDGDGDNHGGGDLVLQGGTSNGLNTDGGSVSIDAGAKNGTGSSGSIALGTSNAGSIAIGNAGSTTTVDGSLHADNLDTSGASTLTLGGSNATSILLGQDTSLAAGKTLSVHGDTQVKSGTGDSNKTFQVQNNAGVSQLNVDTQNNKVTIGTSDTTGTLLVLDKKTSSGDPTGTNGAMYYNSSSEKFRCFQDGVWSDCITPLPISKVASTDTSNSTTTPIDVSGLTFELSANTKYYYKFVILHEADAETTGIGFGVTTPATPTLNNWCLNTSGSLGATTEHWGSYCGVGDASATTHGDTGVGTKFTSTMEGYIQTDGDTGDLTLRMKSESANKTTVKSGSFGILQIVQ